VVVLGDLPALRASHVRPVVEAFASAPAGAICLPVYGGRHGHPVLFDRRYMRELTTLAGEGGARRVLDHHADRVLEVELPSEAVLADVDTPEALLLARSRAGGARPGQGADETGSDPGSGSRARSNRDSD